jgi:PAS domain S-box-containing protein
VQHVPPHNEITEAALQDSETRCRAIFEQAAVGIAQVATSGHYIQVNQKFCDLLGYNREDLLQKTYMEITWPSDQMESQRRVQDLLQGDRHAFTAEKRYVRRDGQPWWVKVSASLVRDEQGEPQYFISVIEDIQERKQAEAALLQREAEFRALVENSPDLIIRFDRHYRCLYVNPRVEQELCIAPQTLAGKCLDEVDLLPDLSAFWKASVQRVFQTGREQCREFSCQVPVCDTENCPEEDCGDRYQHQYWSVRVVPEFNDAGLIQSVLIVSRNITAQKRTDAALRSSEEKFSKVFRASPDPITIISMDEHRFVDVNDSFLELTGYTRQQVVGRHYAELNFQISPKVLTYIQQRLVTERMISNVEVTYRTRAGEMRTSLMSGELIQLDGCSCLLTLSKDITDRKRAEQVLRQQIERQRVITEVTQRIRQSLNFENILSTTVTEVRSLLQCDRVLISQILPDGAEHILVESVQADCLSLVGELLPPDRAVLECQSRSPGTVVSQPDLQSAVLDEVLRATFQRIGVKARLLVPITAEDGLWGLLVAHHCQHPRPWEAFEIEVLEELAAQVAIAIQQSSLFHQVRQLNANLEQEVRERTRQLRQAYEFEATLKSITDQVRDSLDEDQIMRAAVKALGQAIGAQGCNAAMYDLEQGTSRIKYEYTTLDEPFQGYTMRMANFQQGYTQLLQGQYFQCCGLLSYPNRDRVAMLACPVQDNQGVLGDLWVINHPSYGFTEQDIRLTQQVANQCAIAIRQARLYQTSQGQVADLERLNQLKDDFLSTVSHELRTPMANIKMATQMLEVILFKPQRVQPETVASPASPIDPKPGPRPEPIVELSQSTLNRAERYFQILKDEGHREISLINDLLDLSRLDSGADALVLCPILPNIWLHRVVEPFRERAANHQQVLQVAAPDDLPELVTDLSYLERAVTELLNNACKYTPARETIGLSATVISDAIQIQVSNSGVSIPVEERDRIFDKFYRIPNNDPWKHGGTGLGLALVRKLIERLSGTLELETCAQKVVFTITLPLRPQSTPGSAGSAKR